MEHKEFTIKRHPIHQAINIIVASGKGGSIPNALGGMYTTHTEAKKAIDLYVAKREEKNAKTKARRKPNKSS